MYDLANLIATGIILTGCLLLRVFRNKLLNKLYTWASTTKSKTDDFIVSGLRSFGIPALYYLIIYSGLNYLELNGKAERVISIATAIIVTFLVLRLLSYTFRLVLTNHIRKKNDGEEKVKQLGGLMLIINIVIWLIGIVSLVDNLGYNVSTIIAGLGIGGIAVALAAQNILGDLFNYFVIFFDQPFKVGDFIIVDDKMGTVEHIGVKTTRLRSISGEQLIIGNSNLTTARIHNHKRLEQRRIVFALNVRYNTPAEKLKMIPELIKQIIEKQPDVRFGRAHFANFNDWSLRFEVEYFVLIADYLTYMNIQQNINFEIYESLAQHGVSFAFPTMLSSDDVNAKK